uniref:Putative secreted protein n=1 Tax=Anopheles darlingi TaxID=43151 RepID=A0A2M4DJJ2_ANODA
MGGLLLLLLFLPLLLGSCCPSSFTRSFSALPPLHPPAARGSLLPISKSLIRSMIFPFELAEVRRARKKSLTVRRRSIRTYHLSGSWRPCP